MLLACFTRTALGACLALSLSAASVNVYISPPGIQDFALAGAEREDFNAFVPAVRSTDFVSGAGIYRLNSASSLAITPGDVWGGSNGSFYAAFGFQSATTGNVQLDLFGARAYFGFWWSAVDPLNVIQLYSAGSLLGQITRDDIVAFLPGNNSVTSIGGASYSNSSYYGNPNNAGNPLEPYAFIHFVASGVTFDRVVFINTGTNTGFEADNVTARVTAPAPPDNWVPFRDIPVTIGNQFIPEPAPMGLVASGLLLAILRRGRKTAA